MPHTASVSYPLLPPMAATLRVGSTRSPHNWQRWGSPPPGPHSTCSTAWRAGLRPGFSSHLQQGRCVMNPCGAWPLRSRPGSISTQGEGGTDTDDGDAAAALVSLVREDVYGPFSGQVTSTVRHALRRAVTEAGPRLVEAAFLCEISTSAEALSAVYAVLGRRRARILEKSCGKGRGCSPSTPTCQRKPVLGL